MCTYGAVFTDVKWFEIKLSHKEITCKECDSSIRTLTLDCKISTHSARKLITYHDAGLVQIKIK